MNEAICTFCQQPIPHNIEPENGCHPKCAESRNSAAVVQERTMTAIESLAEDRQKKIFEACVRLRDMVCEFGPDFRYALALTSAEISSGALTIEPVDHRPKIVTPGDGGILVARH